MFLIRIPPIRQAMPLFQSAIDAIKNGGLSKGGTYYASYGLGQQIGSSTNAAWISDASNYP